MKEFHEKENVIDFEDAKLALAGEPPKDKNWLGELPIGTTFLTTKYSMLHEPELLRVMLIGCTLNTSQLMLIDIPGSPGKMFIDVLTEVYSSKYKLIDTI